MVRQPSASLVSERFRTFSLYHGKLVISCSVVAARYARSSCPSERLIERGLLSGL